MQNNSGKEPRKYTILGPQDHHLDNYFGKKTYHAQDLHILNIFLSLKKPSNASLDSLLHDAQLCCKYSSLVPANSKEQVFNFHEIEMSKKQENVEKENITKLRDTRVDCE